MQSVRVNKWKVLALDDAFKNAGFPVRVTSIVCFSPQLPLCVHEQSTVNTIFKPTGSDDRFLSGKIMPYSVLSAGDTTRV